ncbi:phenylalanine--tRNA ligase subunit beta [Thermodesulfitimonas sp.]
MRVPVNWLKEFVAIPVAPEELADRLTAAGIPVDTVTRVGEALRGIVTARIREVRRHPNADRLSICEVEHGGAVCEVVTGAPNVFPGAVVPLALPGARLADGTVLKKARFRGVTSEGMLCSEAELGLEERSAGIMILPPGTPVGQDICHLLGLPETVLELDLTPNRGDCLSVFGVAREVAAILDTELQSPPVLSAAGDAAADYISVEIVDPALCGRYAARVFSEVCIGPSPLWMQVRLRLAGMRPINNVVDLTNYVMLELGQPLHAFDYETLRGRKIIVRPAAPGEELVSLDGVKRELTPEDLVIADAERAVAIAGVMGGLDTEVTAATKTVLLEAANFNPRSIRRTSRRLGLRSEASLRFEKGVDIEGPVRAADRMALLIEKIGAGRAVPGVVDNYPAPPEPRTVVVRPEKIAAVLGVAVPQEEALAGLGRLGFGIRANGSQWVVSVPSFRPDVALEEDIVEEVARLYGYDRIPPTLPCGATTPGVRPPEEAFVQRLRHLLCGLGLSEVISYSFIHPASFDRLRLAPDDPLRRVITLKNPISEEQSVLRTTLLPGLLAVLARNLARRVDDVAIFEVGRVFYPQGAAALPEERLKLGLAVTGKEPRGWEFPPREFDFFFLKGVAAALFKGLGIADQVFEPLKDHPSLHPGRAARVLAGGEPLGFMGEIHPEVARAYDLPRRVVVAEFDVVALRAAQRPVVFAELPRFPGVVRDIAVIVPEHLPAARLAATIKAAGGGLLRSVQVFDVYQGPKLPPGTKSIAFSLLFRADDRTLTDEEVTGLVGLVVERLQEEFGAVLRS